MGAIEQIIPFFGREIKLRINTFAPQAGGAVLIQCGDTSVLVTATRGETRDGIDFFPLVVDYEERLYAAGRIPGGFLRREGRPPEKAILTCRLIDRPLRPLFPGWLRDDVQVVATTLSLDEKVPADVIAVTGASIACCLAKLPFKGPMAGVRVGLLNDEFIINPTFAEIESGELDLVVAGTLEGVVMVEAGANQLPEQDMIEAIEFGYEAVEELLKAQQKLMADLGIELPDLTPPANEYPDLEEFVQEKATDRVREVIASCEKDRVIRDAKLDAIKDDVKAAIAALPEDHPFQTIDDKVVSALFKELTKKLMRRQVIEQNTRIDGRKLDEIRPISCMVGVLPRVHGSALFNRGLTQVLSVATLGTSSDAQDMSDELYTDDKKRYLHHYNMPPYSVGEVKPLRSPGRREVGHGALAERALVPVIPSEKDFPYVLRVVSEVLSSNGSTSMGSVCASTLSLMDAGVPLLKPVSGVAMGLIQEGEEVRVLTDIQGIEDFLGDMDFKVAGTDSGITALQMDMKITNISLQTLKDAIYQARSGRLFILDKMLETLPKPRTELSAFAPRLTTMKINPDQIGLVIGPGGKNVKGIVEETGAKIDISDDGTVTIASVSKESARRAQQMIEGMTRKIAVGDVFLGKVTRIIPIGAFVEFLPGKEGMVHISQLAESRIAKVEDVIDVGDNIVIKIREIDQRGRFNLTRLGIHPDEAAAVQASALE
ncbi:MAG: polyribonucleotide nucleotidyltransferase [Cyanobacteria bacterium KgW148]|nr:polyribonucleotide nucleotidyltransferase [Cyanobacteria bacterium KgW148]